MMDATPEEIVKKPIVIAVDGPAASGKGTVSRRIAHFYDLEYLDTGRLYRGVGWLVLARGLDPRNAEEAAKVAEIFTLDLIDGADIRTPEVGRAASHVASVPAVRAALLQFQRDFAFNPPAGRAGTVLDGRDIGTVICPDATVKLFIDASAEERAKRRWKELSLQDPSIVLESVLDDIKRRDRRDASREAAPMKAAQDAHLIDTTDLDIDGAFAAVRRVIDRATGGA
ncbi:(d)CMP kinase [Aquisalinus luteolus]|uniref:Cytidylate kinase n=2 Tax=Aquisalinus luteolus TaxID=1566827 RepID=A0A8J3AAL7_9PROT|nr:(d)CMP kinase [Aquisalinus luteolus]GGI01975.1 cytidylate kinase [Aquisalinus luteolus]